MRPLRSQRCKSPTKLRRNDMHIDELLSRDAAVPPLSADKFRNGQSLIESAAQRDVARLARIHRLRRGRRLVVAVAAAAATGVVVTGQLTPSSHPRGPVAKSPHVHTVEFKTVAQVTRAASAATSDADPTAAPYWKVVSTYTCAEPGASAPCEHTVWEGNDRPGVVEDSAFPATEIPAETVTIGGRTMTWRQANAETWTD